MEKNRRDFLRDIGLGLSAMVFAPKILKPTFRDTLRFNRSKEVLVLNPAWIEAPYEVACFWELSQNCGDQRIVKPCLVPTKKGIPPDASWTPTPLWDEKTFDRIIAMQRDSLPMRLAWDKSYIPPYIKTSSPIS